MHSKIRSLSARITSWQSVVIVECGYFKLVRFDQIGSDNATDWAVQNVDEAFKPAGRDQFSEKKCH